MNFYFYWYFIFYSLYKKFSKDKFFDVFATGLFSVFSASLAFGVFSLILKLMSIELKVDMAKLFVIFGVLILTVNNVYFLPKARQERLYNEFIQRQNTIRDIGAVVLSILSIVLLVIVIRM